MFVEMKPELQISQPLAIFWPVLALGQAKFDSIGQLYCTFLMRKPMIVYNNNVSTFNKWPMNSNLYFQF